MRFVVLVSATNVGMCTGALGDVDRLLRLAALVDPVLPGPTGVNPGTPSAFVTGPLRAAIRAIAGVGDARDRRAVDSAIARVEGMAEPSRVAARRLGLGLPYAAYLLSRDPRYLDVMRQWSGREPPVALRAHAALAAADSAKALALAMTFAKPDSATLVSSADVLSAPLVEAEVLAAVGQYRAALAVYEAIDPAQFSVQGPDLRWAMYPRSLLERGALYERVGARAKAAAAYERYVELMRDADPALRPQVQVARTRLNALRDAPAAALAPRSPR